MVFNGFAVAPRVNGQLLRYEDCDQAFSVSAHSSAANTDLPAKDLFLSSKENDACAYTVFITMALTTARRMTKLYQVDGGECDGGGGLPVECDGNYQHTNLIRGAKTQQRFATIDLLYDAAPINVYNIALISKQNCISL